MNRIDTLVEDMVAIENKAVEQMLALHEAQLKYTFFVSFAPSRFSFG
jgi:hypothetical protein